MMVGMIVKNILPPINIDLTECSERKKNNYLIVNEAFVSSHSFCCR